MWCVTTCQRHRSIEALSALQTLSVKKKDSEILSALTSIQRKLLTWHFVLLMVIWYNMLYQINHVSKIVQNPSVSLETLQQETSTVRECLESFWENGLAASETNASEIAEPENEKQPSSSCMRAAL